MSVESDIIFSLAQLRSMPAVCLLQSARLWIDEKRPSCLRHPHGFWVVLLHRTATEEWRFHYWPRCARNITGMPAMIHTHDRVVESKVVLGPMKNKVYDLKMVKSGGQPIYEVAYHGDRFAQSAINVLEKTDALGEAIARSEQILQVGNSYRIEAHTYHEAVVSEDVEAATIVCMHSRVFGPSRVLGLADYPKRIEFQRDSIPLDELLQLI